jgi:hypothetical protein
MVRYQVFSQLATTIIRYQWPDATSSLIALGAAAHGVEPSVSAEMKTILSAWICTLSLLTSRGLQPAYSTRYMERDVFSVVGIGLHRSLNLGLLETPRQSSRRTNHVYQKRHLREGH